MATSKAAKPQPPAQRITRFTKIRFDGRKVLLEYEVTRPGGGEPDEFLVHSSDPPLGSFVAALRALVEDVCFICEFPVSEASRFTVRGVTLTHDDGLGAVITALKALETADVPLVVNSPHLPAKARESDPGGFCLPAWTVRRVLALVEEAERYLRGDRAQGSLFQGGAA